MCVNPIFLQVVFVVKTVVRIITIIVPIVLIIATMITFVKVVTSGEQEFQKALKSSISKFVAAVLVFLVPTFVSLLMGLLTTHANYESCWVNADDVSGIATGAVETFIAYPGDDYDFDDINYHKKFTKYIKDNDKRESLKEQLDAMKEQLKQEMNNKPTTPMGSGGGGVTPPSGGGNNSNSGTTGGNYTGQLGSGYDAIQGNNLSKLNDFVHGSEGNTDSCTVNVGPAKGESGSLVVDIGDGQRTTSYGLTQWVLSNITESNNCFTNSGYYYYYQSSTFVIGACIPNGSLEGASMCTYKGQLDTVKKLFNKHCQNFDFDSTFTINQIHALLDKAHGGTGIMENTIKSYCTSWNATQSKTVAADSYFYKNYSLNM